MRNQTLVVDINKETCRVLKYKQYDNNNLLQIIVEKDDEKVNLNGYTGYAFFKLPSDLVIKKDCSIQGSEVTINIDNSILSESGKIALDLTLSDGNRTFTLFRINLVIEEAINKDDAIIVEAGWDIVSEIAKINEKIENLDGSGGDDIDLSGYATKDELNEKADIDDIPTKVSQLENDNGYITTIPSEYITESELDAKGYLTEQPTLELNNVVPVEKFGIQSGFDVDVEENTLCFQNMINYCKNDKVIQFPAGNFVFNQIDLGERNNITIKGVSSSFASLSQKDIDTGEIIDNFTNIIYDGSKGTTFFTHNHCTLILENIRFSNVYKDNSGNFTDKEAKTCILLQHASNTNEDRGKCFCFNCGFYGWKVVFGSEFTMQHLENQWGTRLIESDYSYFKQSCVVASKCRFTKNGVGVNQSVDGRLIDCTFNKNDYAIIFRKSSGFSTISDCRIEWNNYNGIYMQNAHDVTVDKCEFDRNGFAGLYADGNTNCNFNGMFRRNGAGIPTEEDESHRTDYVNNVHIYAVGNAYCNFIGSNTVSKSILDNTGGAERPTNASNFSNNTNCIVAYNNLCGCTKKDAVDANKFVDNIDCIISNNMLTKSYVPSEPVEPENPDPVVPENPNPERVYGQLSCSKTSININEDTSLTFTIKLSSAPSFNQVVNLSIEDESVAVIDKKVLTFTPDNYSTKQEVTITGLHDTEDFWDRRTTLIISSEGVSSLEVPVKIINIDEETGDDPDVKYGKISCSESSIEIDENESLTFTIKLSSAPSLNQTVHLELANSGVAILDSSIFIFTPDNYSTPQSVTITGLHSSLSYETKETSLLLSSDNVETKVIPVTVNNIDVNPEPEEPENPEPVDPENPEPVDPEIPIGSSRVIAWFESAGVEWSPISNATDYKVSYKSTSTNSYTTIDDELVRKYPGNMRADILGLKKGKYNAKIVPVINGEEDTSKQIITDEFTVKEHPREGYAFAKQSTMKTSSGGYNDDGTVPSNAQIIYVDSDNFNDVELDVIKDSKGAVQRCVGLVDILTIRQKGYDKTPLIIRMIGKVDASNISGLNSNGYLQIKGCYNITFEGVGKDATINKWGLLVRDARNIEIRNLGFMLFPDDALSLDTGNHNIWIHHNDLFYGSAGSDSDQAKGDGSTDLKKGSTYITIAYNKYWDSGKASLCGLSESAEYFVTYHHNWFCKSDSRHPRIRRGTIHIYNNFYDGNSKYGVGMTTGGSAFVEANDFDCCKYPMLISLQGSDVAGDSDGTFSGEDGGMIKAYNNKISGATRLVYAQDNSTEFDAYLAKSRNETVPSSYKAKQGGSTYNNFDTSSSMYEYNADAPEDVRSVVTTYAGRMEKGDFEWTFTSADNTSYGIISELMTKIKNYESQLIKE